MPCSLVAGALGPLFFTSLPPPGATAGAAILGVAALFLRPARWLGVMVLAACWSLLNFHLALAGRLPSGLAGEVHEVSGVITSIPQSHDDFVSFRFAPQRRPNGPDLPSTLLVRWYQDWPPLSAGQRWRLELLLKPPWGAVNFHGPDREKWLFASRIGGVASVRQGEIEAEAGAGDQRVTALRESILRHIRSRMSNERTAGVVGALAVADRSGITARDRQVLILTGTAHLLAISGLHIGLAAAGAMGAARLLAWMLPISILGRGIQQAMVTAGLLAAACYAALAGFGVATLRALFMLLAVMAAALLPRYVHPVRIWTLALAAVLLLDPLAGLRAGFWFSFGAVAALMLVFIPRGRHRAWWQTMLLAQSAVMLVLLPVSAAWFGGFSPLGLLANLIAIPAVSLLVVPLVLAGVALLPLAESLAGLAWSLAGQVCELLLVFLEFLTSLQGELTPLRPPSVATALFAVLGAVLLLLPRGLPGRWYGLLLIAPLLLPAPPRGSPDTVEVEILDAGQGTAVMVRTEGYTLLYDSGPGDGAGRDRVQSAIVPAITNAGSRGPDRVVISHGDLDHAGGLASLLARYPNASFNANLSAAPSELNACRAPLRWRWRDALFTVLHPSAQMPYLGNDSSCVIAVERGQQRVLLSGDVSKVVEARLLLEGLGQSSVLLVPHHGSRTSSSAEFIAAVRPRVAVATAGLGNRFGFPRAEVRERYERAGTEFWSTGECGALRIVVHADGRLTAASARRARPAPWRWPAAKGCPLGWDMPARSGAGDGPINLPEQRRFWVSFAHPLHTIASTE